MSPCWVSSQLGSEVSAQNAAPFVPAIAEEDGETSTSSADRDSLAETETVLQPPSRETVTTMTLLPGDVAELDSPIDSDPTPTTPQNGFGGFGLINGEHYPPDRLIISYKNPIGPVAVVNEAVNLAACTMRV